MGGGGEGARWAYPAHGLERPICSRCHLSEVDVSICKTGQSEVEVLSLSRTGRSEVEVLSLSRTGRSEVEVLSLSRTGRSEVDDLFLDWNAYDPRAAFDLPYNRSIYWYIVRLDSSRVATRHKSPTPHFD